MSPILPPNPHLDVLKKQAKALLDSHQSGEPDAVQRVSALVDTLPPGASQSFCLRHAQQVLAREYGFPSWQTLADEVNGSPHDWAADRLVFYSDLAASLADSYRVGNISTYGVLGDEMARSMASEDDAKVGARNSIAHWAGCRNWAELGTVAREAVSGTGEVDREVLAAFETMHNGLAASLGEQTGGDAQIAFVDYTTVCEFLLSLGRPSRSYRCRAQGIEGPFVIDIGPRLAAELSDGGASIVEHLLEDLLSMWRPLLDVQSPSTQMFTDPFGLELSKPYGTCLLVAYEIEGSANGLVSLAYPEASIAGLIKTLRSKIVAVD